MTPPVQILAFCASARRESFNRKFLAVAVQAAREAGCEVTLADPNDFAMPLYDGDLEDAQGMPQNAVKLSGLIASHHGLLIASPEYNSMITPLLKNTIDWCSRSDTNPFEGRVAAVLSASPGPLGGTRSLQMAQALLLKLGCHIVPFPCTLAHADKAFDAEGRLVDPHRMQSVQRLVANLARTAARLAS